MLLTNFPSSDTFELKSSLDYLFHAERSILHHLEQLQGLSSHSRKVISRKAKQYYAKQLFLCELHRELLQAVNALSNGDYSIHIDDLLTEISIFKEMHFRLTATFIRFIYRHERELVQPSQISKSMRA